MQRLLLALSLTLRLTSVFSQDIPTWRIGDMWTYDTTFDATRLFEVANIPVSMNPITGDTHYEVEDIGLW